MNQLTRIAPRRLAVNDSYTFLMKELEKVDDTILEPLSGTDWPRDMPVITGGGLLESIASVDVSYASSGGDDDNLFFEAANDIPVIQADMSKQVARTFNFAEYMSFPRLEELIQNHKARNPLKIKGLRDSGAFCEALFCSERRCFFNLKRQRGAYPSTIMEQEHDRIMESCSCSL